MSIFTRALALMSVLLLAAACTSSGDDAEFARASDGNPQEPWLLSTSVDDDGRLITEVTPKRGYRVNVDYPWILSVGEDSQDKRQAAEFSEKKARFVVNDETVDAEGQLRFSICSNSTCLTPVQDLHWER